MRSLALSCSLLPWAHSSPLVSSALPLLSNHLSFSLTLSPVLFPLFFIPPLCPMAWWAWAMPSQSAGWKCQACHRIAQPCLTVPRVPALRSAIPTQTTPSITNTHTHTPQRYHPVYTSSWWQTKCGFTSTGFYICNFTSMKALWNKSSLCPCSNMSCTCLCWTNTNGL